MPAEGLCSRSTASRAAQEDPPGWVSSFTPTAYWLASLTPRRRVGRALDIGTGNGAHALLAAAHADHVIATDVNPRALAFTQISAALNGIDNVETRLGSLFEPVAGETFDLITCNAPVRDLTGAPLAVPRRRPARRPAVRARRARGGATHLADGGHASVLVSWLAESEDEPDERVHDWLEGNGCDAWVLGLSGADPLDHAAGWNEHFTGDAGHDGRRARRLGGVLRRARRRLDHRGRGADAQARRATTI